MSKYNVDLDYAMPLIDISKEELNEIITEADKIISENKENPKELAVAYLKKAQCLYKIEDCDILKMEYNHPYLPGMGFSFNIDDKQIVPKMKRLLEKALELSPEMPEALKWLGTIYGGNKGHIEDAINLLTRAIQIKPDYAAAFNNRSCILSKIDEENIKKAIDDLSEAIRIRPFDAFYYTNRANCYSNLSMHEKVIEDLSYAINCSSDAYKKINRVFLERGQRYMELKEYDKAIDDFSESLIVEMDHADTLIMRAKAYYLADKKDKAKADIEEYLNRKRKLVYNEGREEIFKQIGVMPEEI